MEYLIFWIFCGLIAGAIYRGKGRSEAIGCVAGFLLGPFGILLALASGKNSVGLAKQTAKEENKAIARGEMQRCPYCAEVIRADARVCKHCGRDLA